MNLEEKTVSENVIFSGKIIKVRVDDALRPDGKPCKREIVEHPGGACMLYLDDKEKVLLVKQFRYAYGEAIWEIPAGKLSVGEDPKEAAIRELEEEAGITADSNDVEHLFTIYPTPGYSGEKIYIYYTAKGKAGAPHLDEGEFLEYSYIPVDEVYKMIKNGEIRDSKTIIAIQHYMLEKKK